MQSTDAAYVYNNANDPMTTPESLFLRASMALTRKQAREVLADAKKLTPRLHLSTTDIADETICKQPSWEEG